MLLTDEHKLKLLDLAEDWHLSPAGARASFRWDRLVNYVQQLVDEGSDHVLAGDAGKAEPVGGAALPGVEGAVCGRR